MRVRIPIRLLPGLLFFQTTFQMMGCLAKSDGRVSEEEIQMARHIDGSFAVNGEQKNNAIVISIKVNRRDFDGSR